MKLLVCFYCTLFTLAGCPNKKEELIIEPPAFMVKAADVSFLAEVRTSGMSMKNELGTPQDILTTLKESGVNCIRLRLWKDPAGRTSSFEEVKELSREIRSMGMLVWLSVHYSDTWADPGHQAKPAAWSNLSFAVLKDSVYEYAKKIALKMRPDLMQVGNEINNGFLYNEGSTNYNSQFTQLLGSASEAIRNFAPQCKIMLHHAGYAAANNFYSSVSDVDYDVMAISYYPVWHGGNLQVLETSIRNLSISQNKPVIIAETAYPFTFSYNDFTNNIVGSNNQILAAFSATPDGQLQYLTAIKTLVRNVPNAMGFCYWGAEWVSMKGPQATNGSPWENQSLWDFNGKALPALQAFKN